MVKKILVANRGEIALRILRACKELNIKTVVVHSTADEKEMFVRLADESVCIGPPQVKDSYLNIPSIISAATIANVDAIHPGIGMLSENSEFAKIVNDHGFNFIGPKAEHIETMADKIKAKNFAKSLGLPIIPGSNKNIKNLTEAKNIARELGYAILIKASNGGGGRGIKKVFDEHTLKDNLLRNVLALESVMLKDKKSMISLLLHLEILDIKVLVQLNIFTAKENFILLR